MKNGRDMVILELKHMSNEIKIIYVDITQIKEYDKNPRKNDKAIKPVADSIREFGFKVPIVLDKNNIIIAGHTRLKAAKRLKLKEVPCIIADDLNDDQAKAFRLVDNKTNEFAEWDLELLMEELKDIELDLGTFGFEAQKVIADVKDDEFDVELPKTPYSKQGDIYVLGNHRLIVGDSTDEEVVKRLVGEETIDCMITDPPYNINYEGTAGKIQNDNMTNEEFLNFLKKVLEVSTLPLKKGGAFYIWHSDKEIVNFRLACDYANLEVKQTLIWNKNNFTLGRQDYQWKHEPCLYGWKRGGTHYFVDDRTWQTVIEDIPEIDKMKSQEVKDLLKELIKSLKTTVIDEKKPLKNADHPTMKPILLIARLMLNSTKENENVIDMFGGSGTTLIVAEQLNRKCFMCELDEGYADVIVKRYLNLTNDIEGVYLMRNGQKISLNEITDYK